MPGILSGYTICVVSDAGGVESGLAHFFYFYFPLRVKGEIGRQLPLVLPPINVVIRMARNPGSTVVRQYKRGWLFWNGFGCRV
jgi:hypothetical protein